MMKNSIAEWDKVGVGGIEAVKIAPAVASEKLATASVFCAGMGGCVLLDELVALRKDSRDALAVGINIG